MTNLLPFQRLSLLVLILLVATPYSSCSRIDKCCQPGNILILNDTGNFACERNSEQTQQLLDPREDISTGFPICNKSDYSMVTLLQDIEDKIPKDACLEIFFDKETQQDFLVIVHCYSMMNLRMENSSKYTEATVKPPEILNFRKCCPENSVYDTDKKYCIYGEANLKMLSDHFDGVDFIGVNNGPPMCKYALVDYKIELTNIYIDGTQVDITIPWNGQIQNVTIDMDNGCLDIEASNNHISARLCTEADYCSANPCIRKCCSENKINYNCLDPPQNASIENFRTSLASFAANRTMQPRLDIQSYGLIVGKPCNSYYTIEPQEHWEIGSFGELLVPDYSTFNYVNSCIELIYNDPDYENGLYPFFCFEENHYISDPRYDIKAGLTLTSCCFLLATLLVYICLPSLQNLHGKTLMCHVVSLFFAYACLAIIVIITGRLLEKIDDDTANVICKFIGYTMLFCFHSTFFWLNVMCFDIWRTFRGMQASVSAARKRRRHRNRFLTYCIYAWGLALVLSGLSAVLEYLGVLGSWIGRDSCWFGNESIAEIIFFIVPVTVTLLINVIFFVVTSYRCSKVKTEINRVMANVKDPTTRKFHSNKTRLLMNLKLFVVMGMPWILENIPAYLKHFQKLPVWTEEALFVADVVNSLQGVWIFVLFVLKRNVYRALRKRFSVGRRVNRDVKNILKVDPLRRNGSNSTLVSNFITGSNPT